MPERKGSETDARQTELRLLPAFLEGWTISPNAIDRVHDAARVSVSEVKALTEYQDGKASRLLTVVAFLSALVAAVFTRFAGDIGWPAGHLRTTRTIFCRLRPT
jgi:hypothetical protein